ncbi:MAG: MBL fold metallo-hydrolase [Chloroflexi bacterium]|nr:MBL fold metallo-hydrolase [Chloroflexota bacterium]
MTVTEKIAEGIYLIDAHMWFPGLASVYLVVGRRVALVETGLSTSAPYILEGMRELGFRPEDISFVVVTHAHLDHAGGAGILMKQLPRARLVVHKSGAPHLVDPTRLLNGARRSLGDMVADRYRLDLVVPVDVARVDTVEGGENLDLEGRKLELMAAPGHCPHHICPYELQHRALFCGDLLGTYNKPYDILSPTTPAPEFNLRITVETINRLKQMDIRMLLFSHFGPSAEVERLFDSAIAKHTCWGQIVEEAAREDRGPEHIYQKLLAQIREDNPFMPDWLNLEAAPMYAKGYLTYLEREAAGHK